MPTIEEFNAYIIKLAHHDWYYDYSDDGRVYRAGKAGLEYLQSQVKKHPIYKDAFNVWTAYIYKELSAASRDSQINSIRELIPEVQIAV